MSGVLPATSEDLSNVSKALDARSGDCTILTLMFGFCFSNILRATLNHHFEAGILAAGVPGCWLLSPFHMVSVTGPLELPPPPPPVDAPVFPAAVAPPPPPLLGAPPPDPQAAAVRVVAATSADIMQSFLASICLTPSLLRLKAVPAGCDTEARSVAGAHLLFIGTQIHGRVAGGDARQRVGRPVRVVHRWEANKGALPRSGIDQEGVHLGSSALSNKGELPAPRSVLAPEPRVVRKSCTLGGGHGRPAVPGVHRVNEYRPGRGRHRDLVAVEIWGLRSGPYPSSVGTRCDVLLGHDVCRTELNGHVGVVDDHRKVGDLVVRRRAGERGVAEVDVKLLLVVAQAGILADQLGLVEEKLVGPEHPLGERHQRRVQRDVIERGADERKGAPRRLRMTKMLISRSTPAELVP